MDARSGEPVSPFPADFHRAERLRPARVPQDSHPRRPFAASPEDRPAFLMHNAVPR